MADTKRNSPHHYRRKGPTLPANIKPKNIFEAYSLLFPNSEQDPWFNFLKDYTVGGYSSSDIWRLAFLLDEIKDEEFAKRFIAKLIRNGFDPYNDSVDEIFAAKNPEIEVYFEQLKSKKAYFDLLKKDTFQTEAGFGVKFEQRPLMSLSKFCFRQGYDFLTYLDRNRNKIFISYNPNSKNTETREAVESIKNLTGGKTFLYINIA